MSSEFLVFIATATALLLLFVFAKVVELFCLLAGEVDGDHPSFYLDQIKRLNAELDSDRKSAN